VSSENGADTTSSSFDSSLTALDASFIGALDTATDTITYRPSSNGSTTPAVAGGSTLVNFIKRSKSSSGEVTQSGYATFGFTISAPGDLTVVNGLGQFYTAGANTSGKFSEKLTFASEATGNGEVVSGRKSVNFSGSGFGLGN
jgi:hypothetical protein